MARKLRVEYPGAIYLPPSLEAYVFAKATMAQDGGKAVMNSDFVASRSQGPAGSDFQG